MAHSGAEQIEQVTVAEECVSREVWERMDEWTVVPKRQDQLIWLKSRLEVDLGNPR